MGKLTPDQAKALADLEALRDAPDGDDDYEVVIEHEGHSMRVPYSKVPKTWRERFGFTDPAADAGEGGEGEGGEGEGGGDGKQQKDPGPRSTNRYFR